ncbi:hypothetical protein [Acetobacterium wieringae]|uniref:hypothetical protein n=1 Tax=Acetobacterium wieringae TaxID=52694 RepID=UPI0026ECE378|nr:hypothetical protein [Acetobacterium wieringae]
MKIDMDMAADSQMAINDYLHKDRNNEFPHNAMVTIKQDSRVIYHETESVRAKIDSYNSFVDIIWKEDDRNLDDRYYSHYTNQYQVMKYDGNFLIIFAKDREGNMIEISID